MSVFAPQAPMLRRQPLRRVWLTAAAVWEVSSAVSLALLGVTGMLHAAKVCPVALAEWFKTSVTFATFDAAAD